MQDIAFPLIPNLDGCDAGSSSTVVPSVAYVIIEKWRARAPAVTLRPAYRPA